MKSRTLLVLSSVLAVLLLSSPSHAQLPAKTVSLSKNCSLLKEELNIYKGYLTGDNNSRTLKVLVTSTEGYIDDIAQYNLTLAAQGTEFPLKSERISPPKTNPVA